MAASPANSALCSARAIASSARLRSALKAVLFAREISVRNVVKDSRWLKASAFQTSPVDPTVSLAREHSVPSATPASFLLEVFVFRRLQPALSMAFVSNVSSRSVYPAPLATPLWKETAS